MDYNTLRLFIAINFSPRFSEALQALTDELAAQARFSRPTPPENFHLTLAFIGESERADEIRALMEPSLGPAFTLATAGLGRFARSGGDVCWLGIERSKPLMELQAELARRLTDACFELEKRAFKPHLTLLRQAAFPPGFDLKEYGRDLPRLHERVDRVSLMSSDLSGKRPVYRELYGRELK